MSEAGFAGARPIMPQVLPGGRRDDRHPAAFPFGAAARDAAEPLPPQAAQLFGFLVPGIVHELGNALFKIQGHTQVASKQGQGAGRALAEVLKSSHAAQGTIELLRWLAGDAAAPAVMQGGVLLPRVCELLNVPLRGHGLGIRFRHSSHESPARIDSATTVHAVVELARWIAAALPGGFRGTLVVDLVAQMPHLTLRLSVESDPALLPFPIDLDGVLANAADVLATLPVRATVRGPRELELQVVPLDGH